MLTSFRSAYKTLVFAENVNKDFPVGYIVDFVVNPENGIFEALWVHTPDGLKLLSPKDILRWDEKEVIISDEHDIADPKDFPSIKKTIEKEIQILKNQVFSGDVCLGKVYDFSFDTISPRILSLVVRSGFLFFGTEKIILHSQIKEITEQGIFISDTKVKSPELQGIKKKVGVPEMET